VLFVDEVLAQGAALRGSSVRVTGQCVPVHHMLCHTPSALTRRCGRRLAHYDAVSQAARVTHRGRTLAVDTRLACPSAYRVRCCCRRSRGGSKRDTELAPPSLPRLALLLLASRSRSCSSLANSSFPPAVAAHRRVGWAHWTSATCLSRLCLCS
jgi:hypothetical protein